MNLLLAIHLVMLLASMGPGLAFKNTTKLSNQLSIRGRIPDVRLRAMKY